MKKITVLILAAVLCLLPVSGISAGETSYPGTASYLYQAAVYDAGYEGLGLKAGPDINSQRYLFIPDGTQIYIDQISGDWGHTSYNGSGGWVALKYTRVIGDYRSESPSYGYISPCYYIVHDTEGEGLEIRTRPSSESSTFGPGYDGTIALVRAIQNEWAYVSCSGHYGWMNLAYLSPWNASSSNYQAYVYDTKGQWLPLKASADSNSETYAVIPEGTALNIDDMSSYGWGHTYYNNVSGWVQLGKTRIYGSYPSRIPGEGYSSSIMQYRVVNTEGEGLEFRTGPDTSYSTFGPLYDGTVVYAHATSGEWAYIYCSGNFGWANLTYLAPVQAAVNTPPAAAPTPAPASPSPAVSPTAKSPSAEGISAQNSSADMVCSANIAEYNGITYKLPRGNQVNGLTDLPITPAPYPHVGSFAFYNGRIYYCSRQAGSSDYSTALCTCLPDGSDQKVLIDSEQTSANYTLSNFVISDNKIFFTEFSNGSIYYNYYDLAAGVVTAVVPLQTVKDRLTNMRYEVSDGTQTYYAANTNGSGSSRNALYYRDAGGNETLLATSDLSLAIEALTTDYVYFSKFDFGNADLYRIHRKDQSIEYLDGHPAIAGGIYFNW